MRSAAILRILRMEEKPRDESEKQPKQKKSAGRFFLPLLALVFLLSRPLLPRFLLRLWGQL